MSAKVMKKIYAIKSEVSKIVRNADGYKFKYPTLTMIKNELDPLLEKYTLVIVPEIVSLEGNNYVFKASVFDVESGEVMALHFAVKGDSQQQNGVQSTGATMSYMQRYIPKILFDLDFVDDDPDHKKNSSPQKAKPKAWNMDRDKAVKLWNKYKAKQPESISIEDMKIDYSNWISSVIGHSEIQKIEENQYNELMELL